MNTEISSDMSKYIEGYIDGYKVSNKGFENAQAFFEDMYKTIMLVGKEVGDTKCIYNFGSYIRNPLDNIIYTPWRKFNKDYAEYEWQWYLSGNRNAEKIAKRAKIWSHIMDENGEFNSNYGWQWERGSQLKLVVQELKHNKESRRAVVSIYDGKEIATYKKDYPCTNSIHFQIEKDKLCMTINMRSNDLVFGFCNDQYCFSKLQEMVANELSLEVGWYFHFASNLHIYKRHFNLKTYSYNE